MSVVLPRSDRSGITVALYFLFMVALTAIVLWFARTASGLALIWPVNAIAVVMMTRQPPSRWLIWGMVTATALLLANLLVDIRPVLAIGFASVNMVEILLVATLMRRVEADPRRLRGYGTTIAASLAGATVSTPLAAGLLRLTGAAPSGHTILQWFAASAMGLILLLPALMATRRDWPERFPVGVLLVPLWSAATAAIVFGVGGAYPLLFLLMPCGVVAAFQYRFIGAAVATATIAVVATAFTVYGIGPIAGVFPAMADRLLYLQGFLSALTLSAFPIATLLHQRRQVVTAVRHTERDWRMLTDHSTDMILRLTIDGTHRYASTATRRILGEAPEGLIGRSMFDAIHPDDLARVMQGVAGLTEDNDALVIRYRQRHRDGHYVWLEGAFRLLDEDGCPPELIATVRDIGQRQAAERAATIANTQLAERQRLLNMAEAAAQIGHWRINLGDNTVFWSPEVFRIHGIPAGPDPTLDDAIDAYHPDDRATVREHVERALATGGTFRFEARLMRDDGTLRWVTARGQAERGPGGAIAGLFGVFHDTTEQVAAMAELRAAREAAERALQAKAVFTATMSHEIRTPLTSILAAAQLLRETPDRTERMRHLDSLEHAGRTLSAIVDDVLTFSKLEGGHGDREAIAFDPQELVATAAGMFAAAAASHRVVLDIEATGGQVSGDPVGVRRVLTNLIGNAIKFTRDGSVRIAATPGGDDRWRFEVADTGVGIRADRLDAIFEPFVQADASTTRSYGGTGLGLSICRMLVESMGGTIGVDSAPGTGSRFWFVVPLPPAATTPSRSDTGVVSPEAAGIVRPLTVLVAEDNDTNRYLIAEIVRRLGHHVVAVENGARAVEHATDPVGYPLDIVLMDIQMPVMDGIAATRAIRAWGGSGATVPIHALTADLSTERRTAIAAAGMDGVLAKPIDVAALTAVLASVGVPDVRRERPPIDPARVQALGDTLGDAGRDTLLSLLVEDARRVPPVLRDAVAGGRFDVARREAHGLRGAAASVGADALVAALLAIETGDDATLLDPARLDEVERRAAAMIAAALSATG